MFYEIEGIDGEYIKDYDAVGRQLETDGYAIIDAAPDVKSLTDAAIEFARHIGSHHIGSHTVEGNGADEWLQRHVESITLDESMLLRYFALGCILPAHEGGATVLYDGRQVANRILHEHPDLADAAIRYRSTVYLGQMATHSLVINSADYGPVVRYRGKALTNDPIENVPPSITEDDFYATIEGLIDDAVIVAHRWSAGELMIVNNLFTLHSREPYSGHRIMQRYRFDDPNNQTIILNEVITT